MSRVPSHSVFMAIALAGSAPAAAQDPAVQASVSVQLEGHDTYPEAAIDRPGILPFAGFLATADALGSRAGGEIGQAFALGLGRLELTLEVRRTLFVVRGHEHLTPGLGVLALLEGPIEVDARLTVPLFLSGATFRGFALGPASSYTFGPRFVLSAFSELMVVETEPTTHWSVPIDISLGFQATGSLFVQIGTSALSYDGQDRTVKTLVDEAPVSFDLLWSTGRTWDLGVALALDDARLARDTWSAGMYATWKSVR